MILLFAFAVCAFADFTVYVGTWNTGELIYPRKDGLDVISEADPILSGDVLDASQAIGKPMIGDNVLDAPQAINDLAVPPPSALEYPRSSIRKPNFSTWIPGGHDLYFFALEEVLPQSLTDLENGIISHLNKEGNYKLLGSKRLTGFAENMRLKATALVAYAKQNVPFTIDKLFTFGISKVNQSKGAAILSAKLGQVTMAVIGCHIPPGPGKASILSKIVKRVFKEIDHKIDIIIWTGDFNFRVDENRFADIMRLIKDDGIVNGLLPYDEVQETGFPPALQNFSEPKIDFPPTYKLNYKKGKAIYTLWFKESKVKRLLRTSRGIGMGKRVKWGPKLAIRTPSWTDRVFFAAKEKSLLRVKEYNSGNPGESLLRLSDHLPVFSIFSVKNDENIGSSSD